MEVEIPLYDVAKHETDREVFARETQQRREQDRAILTQVQALVSKEAFHQIQESLSTSGHTHSYQIVDQPVGKPQDDGFVLGKVFVNQTFHGGPCGDDYAGTMSMPLRGGKYFQFNYAD